MAEGTTDVRRPTSSDWDRPAMTTRVMEASHASRRANSAGYRAHVVQFAGTRTAAGERRYVDGDRHMGTLAANGRPVRQVQVDLADVANRVVHAL
jgi:hypothetical protein